MYLKDDGTLDRAGLTRDLLGIVTDRPGRDPAAVLGWLAVRARAAPAGPDGTALTLAMAATSCYALWRVRRVTVIDALVEAAERAAAVYGARGCPAPGAHLHPDATAIGDQEEIARLAGRAGTLDAGWHCPRFLAALAADTLTLLRNGRRARFEPPDTADLDAFFLAGGRADIEHLTLTVERHRPGGPNDLAEQAALWAARRLLGGGALPEERLPLFLTVCFAAQHCHWCATPPGVVAVYRDALAAVDRAPLDGECPHPHGHPDVPPRTLLRYVRALAGFGGDGLRVDADAWHCPRHLAERAGRMLAYTAGYLGLDEPRQKV
ncbi:hypothetical protein [Actinomadura sp. 21ATH]|uniref:hypothetical protein n=1 Tax=Actinomadura sp. 21ATH TaxID=1735444 RepID=UPI0035BFC3B2